MNEKLLQYLWNFKIFKSFDFKDVVGNDLEIVDFNGSQNFSLETFQAKPIDGKKPQR